MDCPEGAATKVARPVRDDRATDSSAPAAAFMAAIAREAAWFSWAKLIELKEAPKAKARSGRKEARAMARQ